MVKKPVNKSNKSKDYSKIIGGGIITVGVIAIALLAVFLFKTLKDENKYTISYHSDDKLAEQIIERSDLDSVVLDDTANVVDTDNFISVEKALDTALSSAGATRQDVRDIDVELERKFGQIVYEVSFDFGQYEYEYYINAETATVVKSFKEID